jgi:hypothetical protein
MKILSDVTTQPSVELRTSTGHEYPILNNADAGFTIYIAAVASPPSSPTNGDIWFKLP